MPVDRAERVVGDQSLNFGCVMQYDCDGKDVVVEIWRVVAAKPRAFCSKLVLTRWLRELKNWEEMMEKVLRGGEEHSIKRDVE